MWHQKSGGLEGGQFFCPVVANAWSCVEKPTIAGATSWTNSQKSLSRIGVKGSRKSRTSSTMDGDVRGSVRAPLSRGMRRFFLFFFFFFLLVIYCFFFLNSNKAFAASNPHLSKLMTQTFDVPSVFFSFFFFFFFFLSLSLSFFLMTIPPTLILFRGFKKGQQS